MQNNIEKNKTKMTALEVLGIILIAFSTALWPVYFIVWLVDAIEADYTNSNSIFYTHFLPLIICVLLSGIIILVLENKKKTNNIRNSSVFIMAMYAITIGAVISNVITGIKVVFNSIGVPTNIVVVQVLIGFLPAIINLVSYFVQKNSV